MKNLMTTLGAVFIMSTAWAQNATLTLPGKSEPKKNTQGHLVSTAAHQPYAKTEKGKFVSFIARLKNEKPRPKKVVNAKKINKTQPENPKAKIVTAKPANRQESVRRVSIQKNNATTRSERTNRPNPARKPVGNGRFSQIGRS